MKPLVVGLATTVTCALAAPATLERRDGAYYYRPHDDSTTENKNETTKSDHDHSASGGHQHYGHKYGHGSTITANVHLTQPTIWAPFANPTVIIDGETYANLDKGGDDEEIKAAIFLNGERIDEEVGGGDGGAGHHGGAKAGGKSRGGDETSDADVSTGAGHVSHGVIVKSSGTKSVKSSEEGDDDDEKHHGTKGDKDKSGGKSDVEEDDDHDSATSTHIKTTTATTHTKTVKTDQGATQPSGTSASAGHGEGKGFITTVIDAIFGSTTKTSTATATAAATTIASGASSGTKGEHKAGSDKTSDTGKGNGAASVHVEVTKHAAGTPSATPRVGGTVVDVKVTKVVKGTTNASPATTTPHAVKPITTHTAATTKSITVLEKPKETQVVKGQSTEKTTVKQNGGLTAAVTAKGSAPAVTKPLVVPTATKVQMTAAPKPAAATTTAKVEIHVSSGGQAVSSQKPVVQTAKATPAATVQKELTTTRVIAATSSTVKVTSTKIVSATAATSSAKTTAISQKPSSSASVKVDIHAEVTKTAVAPAKQVKSDTKTKAVNTGGKPTTTIAVAATKTTVAVQQPTAIKSTTAAATTKVQVQVTPVVGGAAKATTTQAAAATTKAQTSQSKTTQASSGSTSSTTTTTVTTTTSDAGSLERLLNEVSGAEGQGPTGYTTLLTALKGRHHGGRDKEIWKLVIQLFGDHTKGYEGLHRWIERWIHDHAEEGKGFTEYTDVIQQVKKTYGGGGGGSGSIGGSAVTTKEGKTLGGGGSSTVKVGSGGSTGVGVGVGGKGAVGSGSTSTTVATSTGNVKGGVSTVTTVKSTTSTAPIDSTTSSLEVLIKSATSSGASSSDIKDYTELVNILKSGKVGDQGVWKLVIKLYGDGKGRDNDLHRWLVTWIKDHAGEAKGLKEASEIVERVTKTTVVQQGGTKGVSSGGIGGSGGSTGGSKTTITTSTTTVGGGKGGVSVPVTTTTVTTTKTSSTGGGSGKLTHIDTSTSSLDTLIKSAKSSKSSSSSITDGYAKLLGLLKGAKSKANDEAIWKIVVQLYGDGQAQGDDLHRWLQLWINEHAGEASGSKDVFEVVEKVKKSLGGGGKEGQVVTSGSGSVKGSTNTKGGVSVSTSTTTTTTTSKGGDKHTSVTVVSSSPSSLEGLIKTSGISSEKLKDYTALVDVLKGGKAKAGDAGVWKLVIKLFGDGSSKDGSDLHRWLELWITEHADEAKGLGSDIFNVVERVRGSSAGGKGGKVVISGTTGGNKGTTTQVGGGKGTVSVSGKVTTTTTTGTGEHTSEVSIDSTPSSLGTLIDIAKSSGSSASTIQGYSDLFGLLKSGKAKAGDDGIWKLVIKLYGDGQAQEDDFLHRWLEMWIHEHADDVKGSKEFSSVIERVKKSWGTGGKRGGKIVVSGSVGGSKGAVVSGGGKTNVTVSGKITITTDGKHTSEVSIDTTPSSLETLIDIAKSSGSSTSTTQGYTDLFNLLKGGKAKAGDDGVWKLIVRLYGDGQARDDDFLHHWLELWIHEHADEVKGSKEFSSVVEKVKKSWGTGGKAGGKVVISGSVGGGGKGVKISSGGGGKAGVSVSGNVTTSTGGNRTSEVSIDATPSSLESLINVAKSSGYSASTLQGYTDLFALLKSGKAKAGDDGVWKLVIKLYGDGQGGDDDFLHRWLRLWIREHADDVKGSKDFSDFIIKVKANTNDKSHLLVSGLEAILASPTISRERLVGARELYKLLNQYLTPTRVKTIWQRIMALLPAQVVGDDLEKWLVRWVWSNLDQVKDSQDADIIEFLRRFRVQYADFEDASGSSDAGAQDASELDDLLDSSASLFDTLLSGVSSSASAEDLKSYQNLSALLKDGKTKPNDAGLWRLVLRLYNSLDAKSSAHRGLRRWFEAWIHDHGDEEGIKGSKEFGDVVERVRKAWLDRHAAGSGSDDEQDDEAEGDDLSAGKGWFDEWVREHPDDSKTETGVDYRARRETYQTLVDDFSKASFALKYEDDVDEEVERWFEVWFQKHPEASWLVEWSGYRDLVRRFKRVIRRQFRRLEKERESHREEEEDLDGVAGPREGEEPEVGDGWGWLSHIGDSEDQGAGSVEAAPASTVTVIPSTEPKRILYQMVRTSRGVQRCRVVARNVSRTAFRRSKGGLKRGVTVSGGRRSVRPTKRDVAKAGKAGQHVAPHHVVANKRAGRKVAHRVKKTVGHGHGGRRVLKRDGTLLMCDR